MTLNSAGIALIKQYEGCRLSAYHDSVGVWTIGYGHTKGVYESQEITRDEADEMLATDLASFSAEVAAIVPSTLSDNQFSALVSFAYNLGVDALAKSTLLSFIHADNLAGAADQFLRWDRAGGVVVDGLLKRRQAERALFLSA